MDILDIFYNSIIKEATTGRINCFIYYNIAFSTKIYNGKEYECKIINDDILIPTLMINDKRKFDSLLIEYVNTALEFYDDKNFPSEILEYKCYDNDNKICKEKVILAMLFANATIEDFNNPCEFLRKRINFMKNDISCKEEFGYSDILKGDVSLEIKKDVINNETPYQMIFKVISENGDEYVFPRIKLGISDDVVYIYAIQNHNSDNKNQDNTFYKKINRILYKVGEGFNFAEEDSNEKLKDITSSFLVSLNICVAYLYNSSYSKIIIPSFLIERWNSKIIANLLKANYKKLSSAEVNNLKNEQEYIQNNLTNKLIRTFLRLSCHYNNIDVISLPYELDSSLHLDINDNEVKCNNLLLYETYNLVKSSNNKGYKK